MVDVRVREEHGVNLAGRDREVTVETVGLCPAALVEPAVQHHEPAVVLQQVQ
jgi:hypothetical protein